MFRDFCKVSAETVSLHKSQRKSQEMKSKPSAYLKDPGGTLDIESLSISLNVTSFMLSSVPPVQLTGTSTAKESIAIGTKIFNLHLGSFNYTYLRGVRKIIKNRMLYVTQIQKWASKEKNTNSKVIYT